MVFSLLGLGILPPRPSGSTKEVSGENHLLIVSNSCNF
jgi:hypothetical protein